MYKIIIQNNTYQFDSLKNLFACASSEKSGDQLANIAASTNIERIAAQMILADVTLEQIYNSPLIEKDEITDLIYKQVDKINYEKIKSWTVGEFRNWLLDTKTSGIEIEKMRYAFTPEMVSAVVKLMRNQDLVLAAKKINVVTKFNNTQGLKGHFSTRLQPNHPTDDLYGIMSSTIDGLLMGSGDAVIGINPATDNVHQLINILKVLDDFISKFQIPTQSCVLSHVTNQIEAINKNAPIDLVFQSIGGTQKTNESFGVTIQILKEAYEAATSLKRGKIGNNVMYFETGQGSSLSANAHHGIDQGTCEIRAYALAREFKPLLVNSVVGFIGPEYLYNGKQILRAGLEDHFAGKFMGLPMGCDVCYTTHANCDEDDLDSILSMLALSGCNYIMGVPGGDDIMLNYQSTSFHDAKYIRQLLNLSPAPEFKIWLEEFTKNSKQYSQKFLELYK